MSESPFDKMRALLGSPKNRAVVFMAFASAIHFAAYEVARNAILALLTSRRSGFSSASAVSFATACVSPFSVLLLWAYTRSLDRSGPRVSLHNSTLLSVILLASSGIFLGSTNDLIDDKPVYHVLSQAILSVTFVAECGFVQLLYSQHSSFLGSVQSKEQAVVWFAPIAGVASIASTMAGAMIPWLVEIFGLHYLLVVASVLLFCGALCSDKAYRLAEQNGFSPDRAKKLSPSSSDSELSLLERARALFRRVPILGALCIEVLLCQCFSSLLNFIFMVAYKETIEKDEDRARYTGMCYAWINGVSGVLQFGLLPFVLKRADARIVWMCMPTIMFVSAMWIALSTERSLFMATMCFCLMKTIEYSLRGVLTEMVYVSLDYESRFLGKEIIGLTANRFGKSVMALTTAVFGLKVDFYYLRIAVASVAFSWLLSTLHLVRLVNRSDVKAKTA